jgi:hypothetical protein
MPRENIDPVIWGPFAWKFIESVFHSFPSEPSTEWTEEDKNSVLHIANFFHSLSTILPCEKCREDYKIYLNAHPIENALSSSTELWSWIFHMRQSIQTSTPIKPNAPLLTPESTLATSTAFFFPTPVPVPVRSATPMAPTQPQRHPSHTVGTRMGMPNLKFKSTRGCNCGRGR